MISGLSSLSSPPSEGLCSILHLLFQLCPSAGSALPPPPQVCDFEGLFVSVSKPSEGEVPMNLLHRVAELLSEACLQFQTPWRQGRFLLLVSLHVAGFLVRLRSLRCGLRLLLIRLCIGWWGTCPPSVPSTYRLTRQLRSSCWPRDYWTSVNVVLLLSVLLHWLKELGFVPPDPALFEQRVQSLSVFCRCGFVLCRLGHVFSGQAS